MLEKKLLNLYFLICRMYSFKSFIIVAIICTSLCAYGENVNDQQARLLVSKQVLNKLLVQDSDILVKVSIHKII